MRRFQTICMLVMLAVLTASSQVRIPRIPCTHDRRAGTRTSDVRSEWDASRTYRQAVILVNFPDMSFSMPDPVAYYDSLFNMKGYNVNGAHGSVADYFRDQSNGKCNLQFDIIGPVKVSVNAKKDAPFNFGSEAVVEAVRLAVDSLGIAFAPYDWDGIGEVPQVIHIFAGYCAPLGGTVAEGYLCPNSGMMSSTVFSKDNMRISYFSASAEKWYNDMYCGLGTICHEFSHSLGLPDIYPTGSSSSVSISIADEWDLMDGGNYTCWGWSPPNYSAEEKFRLGWITPEDLTEGLKVKDLKPLVEGGKAYREKITEDEYYLVENRQQNGWDNGLPGRGLLVSYTNYSNWVWRTNSVNEKLPYRYFLIPADGMDYDAWDAYLEVTGLDDYEDMANRFRSRFLSTAAYPLKNDSVDVHECLLESLALTDITMDDNGRVSFKVVNGTSGLTPALYEGEEENAWYDLLGRRLQGKPTRKGIYIHNKRKVAL